MKLYHFNRGEFTRPTESTPAHSWFDEMSPRLLVMLDLLRHQWGKPIRISGHPRALGREDGDSASWHNIDRWGVVYAADIQPEGVTDRDSAYRFYMLALDLGFTGIGFYPGWTGGVGFHLDVRPDREPGNPATWGRIERPGGLMNVGINNALDEIA